MYESCIKNTIFNIIYTNYDWKKKIIKKIVEKKIKGMEFIGKVDVEWSNTKLTWMSSNYGVSVEARFNGASIVKRVESRFMEVNLQTFWAMEGHHRCGLPKDHSMVCFSLLRKITYIFFFRILLSTQHILFVLCSRFKFTLALVN